MSNRTMAMMGMLLTLLVLVELSLASSDSDTTNKTIPAPIVVAASEFWEGSDGPWSSFALRVGTPAQNPRVFVSTAGTDTWVVLDPQGCPSGSDSTCANDRGGLFNPNQSSTWTQQGLFGLGLETNLEYNANGDYGLETVGLGLQATSGPTMESQVVAGINQYNFYLGIFGLNPQPTNFSNFDNPQPSFFTALKNQNLIPSLSWSYTAGAPYRLKKVFGSLIFGGYDVSKYYPNDFTFPMAPDISRDLVVGLQSITLTDSGGKNTSLLPAGIFTFIDSTIPYIYLPLEACQAFEKALGLTYNTTLNLYLVNETLHNSLVEQNYTFTFQLANSETGGSSIEIVLPYSSFDLTAEYPLVPSNSSYFPLKIGTNDTQYTLGRTFLQEAYLTADYERQNFSVSQCRWEDGLPEHIIPILSTSDSTNTTGSTNSTTAGTNAPPHSSGVSAGPIAGGVVGGLLVLAALGYLAFAFATCRKPFKRRPEPYGAAAEAAAIEKDHDDVKENAELEGHNNAMAELSSPGFVNEVQGSPTPPPGVAHEMMGDSMYSELPGDYPQGGRRKSYFDKSPVVAESHSLTPTIEDEPVVEPHPVRPTPARPSLEHQEAEEPETPISPPVSPPASPPIIPAEASSQSATAPRTSNLMTPKTKTRKKWRSVDYTGADYESDHDWRQD